jgi:hypothetical protein
MNMLEEILAHLARSPEEQAGFWAESQRQAYYEWWTLENCITALQDDEESADQLPLARAKQDLICYWQIERGEIRDRIADDND